MKKIILLAILLPALLICVAQDVPALLKQANDFETSFQEVNAYDTYKQVLKMDPRNFLALWKSSELCSRIGNRQSSKTKKIDFFNAAKSFAETAIKVNPYAADGYYALSVAMGRRALIGSGKEKIAAVKEIKVAADKALSIDPKHGRAWHVLGKWNYEISNLNIIEKTAVKIFFGGFPPASFSNAIHAYEKARQFEPDFPLNYLELAKAYHRNGQADKAIYFLEKLPAIPNRTIDDGIVKAEGKKLLNDWK